MMKKWIKRLWFVPPVIIGVAVLLLAPSLKEPPQKLENKERAIKVRFIDVLKLRIIPTAVGYGVSRPGRTWEAVAEVAGQVVWTSEKLKNGHFVGTGTELLRIDDSSYRLALAQIEAQHKATLVKYRTTKASLAIAERDLNLLRLELKRNQQLAARGTIAKTVLEEVERKVLNGEAAAQSLRNILATTSAEAEVLIPQKAIAELELSNTVLRAPFDVRIGEVKINQAQYANKGQLLFTADGMDVIEIDAQFPIGKLRPLIEGQKSQPGPVAGAKRPGALGLAAVLRLHAGTHTIEWEARVDRVSGTIDPRTQTIGVVVAVDDPYSKAEPGKRPPLARNTFVEIELRGKPHTNQLVVPVFALHENKIYLLDENNRLVIRPVEVRFTQGGLAVISKGLRPGERIIVSDIVPAVEGMLLEPIKDERTTKRMIAEATGKGKKK